MSSCFRSMVGAPTALLLVLTANIVAAPLPVPPNPTSNIPWSGGMNTVADIQSAFNNGRTTENGQLGTSIPLMPPLPAQATWDAMTASQKGLWLINQERVARGVPPLTDIETNVIGVAQTYAEFLLNNNRWGHNENGSPWDRLTANPTIGACYDVLNVAENLAVFVSSGPAIPLPVERAIYDWIYNDAGSAWGHRVFCLWDSYNDNSGPTGQEGFLGMGVASGGPYQGPFASAWPVATLVVMNAFDPCANWQSKVFLPLIRKP